MKEKKRAREREREERERERRGGRETGKEERECVSVRVGGRLMCCSFSPGHTASH